MNISACTSGRGNLIIADFEGNIYFINRQLAQSTFKGYEIRVSHIHQMKQHNLLITVGVGLPTCRCLGGYLFSVAFVCVSAFQVYVFMCHWLGVVVFSCLCFCFRVSGLCVYVLLVRGSCFLLSFCSSLSGLCTYLWWGVGVVFSCLFLKKFP